MTANAGDAPDAPPAARLVHALPGRARLRVPTRRGDDGWMESTAHALAALPGVAEVVANVATGSLLLRHDGDLDALLAEAEAHRILRRAADADADEAAPGRAGAAGGTAPFAALRSLLGELDPRLVEALRGRIDPTAARALVTGALGLLQIARGQVLPPGYTLLNDALNAWLLGAAPSSGTGPADEDGGADGASDGDDAPGGGE